MEEGSSALAMLVVVRLEVPDAICRLASLRQRAVHTVPNARRISLTPPVETIQSLVVLGFETCLGCKELNANAVR